MIPTLPLISLTPERLRKLSPAAVALDAANERLDGDDESAIPDMALIAQEVEKARAQLQALLLAQPEAAQWLFEALQQQLHQGIEVWELWLDNATVEPAAETGGAEQTDSFVPDLPANLPPFDSLPALHLMPAFLLHAAHTLLDFAEREALTPAYCAQLGRLLSELQQKRQQMIAGNLGLVAFIARKYKPGSLSFEDMMQEGIVGLIKAVDRFDYRRNIRFSTYAAYWIKQAVNRLIIKQDKIVRLPVALAEKAPTVFQLMRECYLQQQRWPTLNELKAQSPLSEDDLKTISSYYQATHQLDPLIEDSNDDDGISLMERLSQQQFALPLDELIAQNLVQYLNKALDTLPDKEATILMMRFGLKNHREMTLQAVADQLHVTRERVRQIQNDALKKLKQQFGFDLMLFLEPND